MQPTPESASTELRQFFMLAVHDQFKLERTTNDPDIEQYVVDNVLLEFIRTSRLEMRSVTEEPFKTVEELLAYIDPVHGSAPTFDYERTARKQIGDTALFLAGMCPEVRTRHYHYQPFCELNNTELRTLGKESYFVVSRFDLFEYEKDAPLFKKLYESFEPYCAALVRVEQALQPKRHLFH